MGKIKYLTFLMISLIVLSNVKCDQSQELSNVCSFYAGSANRYGVQYQKDLSNQRCSFCQYSQTDNAFASGCLTCPDYTTGSCPNCSMNYVLSQTNKICIPCPQGSTCCIGNTPSDDPNYQAYTKNQKVQSEQKETQKQMRQGNMELLQDTNTISLQVQYEGLLKFSGIRQMTCLKGYFALGSYCQQLPVGCVSMKVLTDSYYCQQCDTGYYLDSNNICSNQCSALYLTSKNVDGEVKPCGSCLTSNKCLSCISNAQTGYFGLQASPSSAEFLGDTKPTTFDTLQVCNQCPANCVDCSNLNNTCKQCSPYYFLDATKNTCTLCNPPTEYVSVNAGLTINQFYSGCTSNAATSASYTFTNSVVQIDSLSQNQNRPIVTLKNGLRTACDLGCLQCTPSQTDVKTVCSACIYGYYLDPTNVCQKCPANSLACKYNPTLQKPQVLACAVDLTDLSPPYSKTFYLQFNDITVFYDQPDQYDPDQQCVQNTQNCKEMISDDITQKGLCTSCYSNPTDFAIGLSQTPLINSLYVLTKGKTCRACNGQGFKTCVQDDKNETEIVVSTCQDGYVPTPANNICIPCNESCSTCDDQKACLTCNPSYFRVVDDQNKLVNCQKPYVQGLQLDGCADWNQGLKMDIYPNCKTCQPNYAMVSTQLTPSKGGQVQTVNLCMSCPSNCTTCGTDANRIYCLTCSPGYYLLNAACVPYPSGCATFNGQKCTYCQYGYRLINDSYCTLCANPVGVSFSNGQWFSCPGAQCANGSSDDPVVSFSISLVHFKIYALIILAIFL